MTRGKHTPAGDRSFAVSVVVHLAAGVALVAAVAGAFWGIGQVRGPEDGPVIVGAPDDDAPSPSPTPEPVTADPEPTASPRPTPTTDDDGSQDDGTEVADEGGATDDDTEVTPSEVSIQVLDATGDGGGRAQAAVEALRADGWRIVATNRAARYYERSTIFYTPGHEAAARALADRYPEFDIVQEKPDNLTSSVAVHVVVGGDYPES